MSTPAYYRAEAARWRELAQKSSDAGAIARWRRMALEYEQLAEIMAGAPQPARSRAHSMRVPMQQQPVQQQQSRAPIDA